MLIRPTDIYSNEFRTVSRQTVSAVLIATPEAVRRCHRIHCGTRTKSKYAARVGVQRKHLIAAQQLKACVVTFLK